MIEKTALRTPKEIIVKALYAKLLGLQRNDEEADLRVETNSEDLTGLLGRFLFQHKKPPGINKVDDFKELRREFAIALRHRKDQNDLCLEVAKQALDKGLPYVSFGVSPAARMLKSVVKEVLVEVNRAKSLRFNVHPDDYDIYWAEYDIFHDTSDVVLQYFEKRYPMRTLLMYSRRDVYWLKKGQMFSKDMRTFSLADIDSKHEEPKYYRATS